ncbi:glycine zipper domain-containing protein [Acinetobacter haemolyticus]|uniref:glycine zipper domain-containing protein n=1 Tax=Acinetobacter haemolyticus TaxID=29430 RepID=UPI000F7410AC|nr:glycine zipper domain-containing protein [Acinetobacter haemolyticus]RSN77042.1 hypothetical protein EA769_05920 [Acinetobacter haemolyticus]
MIYKDKDERRRIQNIPNDIDKDLEPTPPVTKSGTHPVESSVGAVGGALAGAAVGSTAGPVGTAVGGALGALMGGVFGNAVGEAVDPTIEDTYWREHYFQQPYYSAAKANHPDLDYERDYRIAYRIGYENSHSYDENIKFEDVETELRAIWHQENGESRLSWDEAKHASRDAWYRRRALNK